METIRREYQTIIEEHWEENRKSAWETREWLQHSSVAYHGRCVRTLQIPKVFTRRDIRRFQEIVSVTYGIFQKVIREYLDNPAYRKLFPFSRELEDMAQLYQQITGQTLSRLYRPPQGIYSEENLKMARELGYHTVFWSLAYQDWNNNAQPSREQAFAKLLPRTHNGAIVLLHSTSATNAEILPELLTRWEEMGYTFAPLTELPGLA